MMTMMKMMMIQNTAPTPEPSPDDKAEEVDDADGGGHPLYLPETVSGGEDVAGVQNTAPASEATARQHHHRPRELAGPPRFPPSHDAFLASAVTRSCAAAGRGLVLLRRCS